MPRKQIEVFENDYQTLLLRAGEPNKICFVVRELINLSNECAKDVAKLKAWNQPPPGLWVTDKK